MLDLVEILKNCPKGTKLYSTVRGEVEFDHIDSDKDYPIHTTKDSLALFTGDGKYYIEYDGECVLFPSKDQRDWSKFKAPVKKFDYNTLQQFDKVLVRDRGNSSWKCDLLSHRCGSMVYCVGSYWTQMIPYNDETKHLVGTTYRPDEKYIWWE